MRIFVLLLTFFSISLITTAQTSKDNNSGDWTSGSTWIGETAPQVNGIKNDVTISGNVYRDGNLVFDGGILTIETGDTLIINGDLSFNTVKGNDKSNTTDMVIESGGILIVLGSVDINNKVDVGNGGFLIVTEDFRAKGGSSEVIDVGDGESFIFGSTGFPNGQEDGFPTFECPGSDPYVSSGCNYGNAVDLELLYPGIFGLIGMGGYILIPPGTTDLICGENVNLTTRSGADTYEWFRNGTKISGETSNTLIAELPGTYIVNATKNSNTFQSNEVTITVSSVIAIQTQPVSQSVCAGETVTFNVVASGPSLSYQWQLDGSTINGATTDTYTIGNVAASDMGSYAVTIEDQCAGQINSDDAVLDVSDPTVTGSLYREPNKK